MLETLTDGALSARDRWAARVRRYVWVRCGVLPDLGVYLDLYDTGMMPGEVGRMVLRDVVGWGGILA